jgi:short subunit dehydrogenase-like uncharacterized protein
MGDVLIYGANGYTGGLITREATARGLRPILGGRNAQALSRLAQELDLPHRVFNLESPAALDDGIQGMTVVLHCAGPFAHTSKTMADACRRMGVHYLDITGEIEVFEALAARSDEARAAGVMLLPGVGFDVVPSDCLAAHLHRLLPTATHLALGFQASGRPSRGTAITVIENLHRGGMVRQDGKLRRVPTAWKTRVIDFGKAPIKAITIPWGDVATAYYSTGIPNIEVYTAVPWGVRVAARAGGYLGWLLSSSLVQRRLKNRIQAGPPGPTAEQRSRNQSLLWGEVSDPAGRKAVSRLRCPDGYTLTARAAVTIVERVLAGQSVSGFQTPSMAFGADFLLGLEGVSRTDE